ncbi:MAG: helix-turn-helix domain-containing protein [Candidatus Nitrosopumilus limneticus]|nr:ArsR family transcriptional regulator [Candidatus Nitrosopumilus limneticus]MDC4212944.1 helix-turn-helix domain-containing protein [Candidatus Nitrosopumilus limneticus]MDC4213453.1 helix-turn-helix domain-containing protein [Candidatus Nitrosopumilus limneticus]MDC4215001.1 helix-turn-helix domain-containing protein [Candidatus Nitrosopumilus limneticus]MDC4217180.1 helix-turn-helix domain-containing protein [Candidatus Nitrosopumilus limneticus]
MTLSEEELEMNMDLDSDDDDLDSDLDDDSDSKDGGILHSTSKRVRMIFSVMASPNRIDILRILNSKGPLTYSELKSLAGFKSKKESGKFAYHLRKLLRQSLVALNKSERRYTITNLGKLVLSLARQIEERSIIESGKMYVRTSGQSIEEFNSHKIIQSLVREGSLPLELAQKITEEVENRIYKYQITYLTGAIIRDMVNSVLLEHGHEEYRNKLARLGIPVYDVHEMVSNLDHVDNGAEGLLFNAGQKIFAEHLLTNVLPKDVADNHLSGDLHISNPGMWSMIPDTIFVNVKELLDDGLDLGGKYLNVSRINESKQLDEIASSLCVIISLLSKEASQEIVLDGLSTLFLKYSKSLPELEEKLTNVFAIASTTSKYNKISTNVSIRLQLGTDTKIINSIISAYKKYVAITPIPKIGLIIDNEKGKINDVSQSISEILLLGGKVTIAKGQTASNGVTNGITKSSNSLAINLESVSINLPRLAFESNKDETYFRARLALLMKPVLSSMALRKKEISDLTRRGLNPILAKNTQYMQKSSVSLVINLVGLEESVFNILGFKDNKDGRAVLHKVIETAIDVGAKKGKELGDNVIICMTETEASYRFATLDGEKYGKNSSLNSMETDYYSQGIVINSSEIHDYTPKTEIISESNKISKLLNGGLLITLDIDKNVKVVEIKKSIEKIAELVPSFKLSRQTPICGQCGFKDQPFEDKCPKCKSPYLV